MSTIDNLINKCRPNFEVWERQLGEHLLSQYEPNDLYRNWVVCLVLNLLVSCTGISTSDQTFNAIYLAFSKKFSKFTYESSDDVVAIYENELLVGRIFFLKDTSEAVRFIQLFIGRETDLQLFGHFFKIQLKTDLTTAADGDIMAKADIQLTTFEIHSLALTDLDLKTTKLKKAATKS